MIAVDLAVLVSLVSLQFDEVHSRLVGERLRLGIGSVRDADRPLEPARQTDETIVAIHVVDLTVLWSTSVSLGVVETPDPRGEPRFNRDILQVFMIVAGPAGSGLIHNRNEPNSVLKREPRRWQRPGAPRQRKRGDDPLAARLDDQARR